MKGVIFDVDGTLLDSMPLWKNLGEDYLRDQGIEPEENLNEKLLVLSLGEGIGYLVDHYSLQKTKKEVWGEIYEKIKRFYEEEVECKKGVREFLESLRKKDIPMVIITSTERGPLEAALTRLKIKSYFTKISTTSEEGKGKEVPDLFIQACEFLGLKPQDVWVIEDAHFAATSAKKAGNKVVGIFDPLCEVSKEEMKNTVDVYIHDFFELLKGDDFEENGVNHSRQ